MERLNPTEKAAVVQQNRAFKARSYKDAILEIAEDIWANNRDIAEDLACGELKHFEFLKERVKWDSFAVTANNEKFTDQMASDVREKILLLKTKRIPCSWAIWFTQGRRLACWCDADLNDHEYPVIFHTKNDAESFAKRIEKGYKKVGLTTPAYQFVGFDFEDQVIDPPPFFDRTGLPQPDLTSTTGMN